MRHTRIALILLAAAVSLAACTAATTTPAARAATGTTDNFWIHCLWNGQPPATIDPVVNPGSTTTSHYHVFYGNTTTGPDSTPDTLRAAGPGSTSCSTATDTAAYWAPELLLHPGETQTYSPPGLPCTLLPSGAQACGYSNIRAYYGTQGAARAALVVPPAGEEAVGGDRYATGPQPVTRISWACGGSTPFEQYPYDCTPYINTSGNNDQDGVVMRVIFPRCWDGTGTAPADFTYPATGTGPSCPAGSKVLPLINVRFHTGIVNPCLGELDPATGWQVPCPPGSQVPPAFGFRMGDDSEMPWYDAHGDFENGWQYGPQDKPGGLDDLVTDCLKLALPCPVNPRTAPVSNMPS